MITVICPLCDQTLSVPEDEIGTTGHCSKCEGHISILEALEPVPHSEAPPAALKSDPGDGAAGATMYQPRARQTANGETVLESSLDVQRNCLVRLLIDLNQVAYLYRYKRNEFPESKEFKEEREARDAWWEKVGAFGEVLFDTNIKRRLDNIQTALGGLKSEPYRELQQQIAAGFQHPNFMPSKDILQVVELIKLRLQQLDDHLATL